MQRLVTVFVVLACILHVNSYMVKEQSPYNNEAKGDSYLKSGQNENNERMHSKKKARQISNSYSKPSENNDLESIVLSLNTGIKKILEQHNKVDYFDKYAKQIVKLFKGNAAPMYRAVDHKYSLKPQQVQLNAERPSTKFELNANVLSKLLGDILKSDAFKENFDHVVKQASIIYRTIKEEGDKEE